jgi:hypothetical protein
MYSIKLDNELSLLSCTQQLALIEASSYIWHSTSMHMPGHQLAHKSTSMPVADVTCMHSDFVLKAFGIHCFDLNPKGYTTFPTKLP